MINQAPSDIHSLWKGALAQIETLVSKAIFQTWFKDTHIVRFEDGVVVVGVPNQFTRDWLQSKYHKIILKVLRDLFEPTRSVEYVVSTHSPGPQRIQTDPILPTQNTIPLVDVYVNKNDNLNPRYVFDTFVVGSFNELAYAAAQSIIDNLGNRYNPFFVYGQTGHGKTHLIQAIGNEVKKKNPLAKIFYVTSERFTQELVNAIQENSVNAFKEKYRKYDVFIMDDIQFIGNKEKTQEELFHLFNALHDNNRQIVFSSDKHPNYIPGLEDRLKSRFSAGMTVDIPAPDKESRLAILKTKTAIHNIVIGDEILDFLATNVEGNIRELEGALNSIIGQIQLKQRILTLSEIREVIKNSVRPKRIVSVKEVVKTVAGFYGVSEDSIYKKTRKKEIVKPRQIIMYILREDFNVPYPAIGQKLGDRDHTTVIHSYEKIKQELPNDPSLEQEVSQIRAML